AGADYPGVGLLQQRADEDEEVHTADSAGRQAGDLAEHRDDGEVPAGDEEAVLRPDEVQVVPRAARHQVPGRQADLEHVRKVATAGARGFSRAATRFRGDLDGYPRPEVRLSPMRRRMLSSVGSSWTHRQLDHSARVVSRSR